MTAPDPLRAIAAALGPAGTVEADAVRRAHAVWLDTPDRRLAAAGIALRYDGPTGRRRRAASGNRLVASGGGIDTAIDLPNARWPAIAHDVLPDRPDWADVRARVFPRALVEVAAGAARTRVIRLRDDQGKIIARGVLESSPGHPDTILQLTPLRGYDTEVEALVARLARSDAVEIRSDRPVPGPTEPRRPVRAIVAGQDAATAVAAVLLNWLDIIDENAGGVIEDIDTEYLHDFRVAVRRSRSMVKLAGDALPAGVAERFAPELKRLGDLTTPTRDLDVFLLGLRTGGTVVDARNPLLTPVVTELKRQRAAEFHKLRRHLRGAAYRDFHADWRRALDDVPPAGIDTIDRLAARRIDRAYRKVRKRGRVITPASPVEDLHDLRKRCKELRYLLDAFKPVLDAAAYAPALRGLKNLQDCLGRLQDAHMQNELIHQIAAHLMRTADVTAPTILALGAATTRLDENEKAVRAEFAAHWRAFERPAVRDAMTELLAGAA